MIKWLVFEMSSFLFFLNSIIRFIIIHAIRRRIYIGRQHWFLPNLKMIAICMETKEPFEIIPDITVMVRSILIIHSSIDPLC